MATTLKQQIRKVIKQHYGESLWVFREDANYGEATESFVSAASKVIKGEIEYSSDWQCDLAKYGRADAYSKILGDRIKHVRLQKGVTKQELAKKMKVHPNFLENFEEGNIVTFLDTAVDALRSLEATREDKDYVAKSLTDEITLEQRIRDVIGLYYGRSLWSFRPQFEYDESIDPFVHSLAGLANSPSVAPPLGYKTRLEDNKHKIIVDPATAPIVRSTFKAVAV